MDANQQIIGNQLMVSMISVHKQLYIMKHNVKNIKKTISAK